MLKVFKTEIIELLSTSENGRINIYCLVCTQHMDFLKIVYSETDAFLDNPGLLDKIALLCTLDDVVYISELGAKCSFAAMDGAALVGKLEIVKYLHLNRSEGC